jgi:hypothetical protein
MRTASFTLAILTVLAPLSAACGGGGDGEPTFTGEYQIVTRTIQADCTGDPVDAPIQAGDEYFRLEETEIGGPDNPQPAIAWYRCSAPGACTTERGTFIEDIEGWGVRFNGCVGGGTMFSVKIVLRRTGDQAVTLTATRYEGTVEEVTDCTMMTSAEIGDYANQLPCDETELNTAIALPPPEE